MARRNWSFDETLLALDLYLDHRPRLLDDSHPEVEALSRLLRRRARDEGIEIDERFRNPNGVAMKLANISSHDPEAPPSRAGLGQGAKEMERAVWAAYGSDAIGRKFAAEAIRRSSDVQPHTQSSESIQTQPLFGAQPRIFVTGMWGFNPAREGYVGFTNQSIRDRFIADYQDGDLMLVVGQKGEFTQAGDIGRVLGVVELEPAAIHESSRFTPEDYRRKVERFGPDRWQHALPIKRAWLVPGQVKAKFIAPTTCASRNARVVGANYIELTAPEVANVLNARMLPTKAFGADEWNLLIPEDPAAELGSQAISRGPAPTYGTFTVERHDGETSLYVMVLEGCVDALFPERLPRKHGHSIIKVGMSNDPDRRRGELNWSFPPGAAASWKLFKAKSFPSGREAYAAEQRLIGYLQGRSLMIGMEFACVPDRDLELVVPALAEGKAGLLVA